MAHDRVAYATAGEAMRAVLSRASHVKLVQSEWRTLGAVIVLTGSYSKLEDEAFVAQIASIANLGESTCRRALKRLDELGVITYNGRRGPGRKPLITLSSKTLTVHQAEQSETDRHAEQSSEAKPAEITAEDRSTWRAGTEKSREEDVVAALNDLDFTASQRARALSENPERVLAWIARSKRNDIRNAAAYAWKGISGNDWPQDGESKPAPRHSDGPFAVDALNFDTDTLERVGVYDNHESAKAAYLQHEPRGAVMYPLEAVA